MNPTLTVPVALRREATTPMPEPATQVAPAPLRRPSPRDLTVGYGPGLLGTVLAAVGLLRADAADIGPLGLLPALGPAYWVGLTLLLIGGAMATGQGGPGRAFAHAGALTALLHGAPAVVEPLPRFPVAYLHASYAEVVASTGRPLPAFDARASWSGFFDLFGMLGQWGGPANDVWMRSAGVGLELLYLLPLIALARALSLPARAQALAVLLFPLLSWVGQDYFAPQSLAQLLLLGLVAVLLGLVPGDRRLPLWMPCRDRLRSFGGADPVSAGRSGASAVVYVLAAAIVVSHQLTPLLVVTSGLGLLAFGATRLRLLPAAVLFATIGFFSYLGVPYWRNHLTQVTGGLGDITGNVSSGVGARLGGSTAHIIVVDLRLAVAVGVALSTLAGVVVLARRGSLPLPLLALGAAPLPIVALQNYGGEGVLRMYLFALPACVLVLAAWWAPALTRPRRRVAVAALLVVALPVFMLARFGNESFEQVRPGELAAFDFAVADTPIDGTLVLFNSYTVSGLQPLGSRVVLRGQPSSGATALEELDRLPASRLAAGVRVLLTPAQVAAGIHIGGLPSSWGDDVVATLSAAPGVRVVYASQGSYVFALTERTFP